MSIKEKILSAIKQTNSTAINLTINDIALNSLTVLTGDTRNTQITVSANAPGYSGSVNVKYSRKDLNALGTNLTFYSDTGFTEQLVIDKINETCNTSFITTDFQSFTIPPLNVGKVERLTLSAANINYEWFGSVVVSIMRGNSNQSSNESVLLAIAELNTKFDHFFEVTPIVNRVAGFSGDVTKEMLGIHLIDNTPDTDKPISFATQAVLNTKVTLDSVYLVRNNISNDDLTLGAPVYALDNFNIDKANASVNAKLSVIGLVSDDMILSQHNNGNIKTTGILKGTFEQWELVTGMAGGLLTNRKYFLDVISGKLTPFMPETALAICPIGKAVSQTEFSINIETIINL